MGGFGDWISSAWKTVKDTAVKVFTTAKEAVVGVTNAVKKGVSTVYNDAKGVVNFVGTQIDKGTTATSNLIGGFGSAISSPLTWIALAIGGIVLLPLISKA